MCIRDRCRRASSAYAVGSAKTAAASSIVLVTRHVLPSGIVVRVSDTCGCRDGGLANSTGLGTPRVMVCRPWVGSPCRSAPPGRQCATRGQLGEHPFVDRIVVQQGHVTDAADVETVVELESEMLLPASAPAAAGHHQTVADDAAERMVGSRG